MAKVRELNTPEALAEVGFDEVTANFILAIESGELDGDIIVSDSEIPDTE